MVLFPTCVTWWVSWTLWFLAIFLLHFLLLFELRAAFVVMAAVALQYEHWASFVGVDSVRQQVALVRGHRDHSGYWQVI